MVCFSSATVDEELSVHLPLTPILWLWKRLRSVSARLLILMVFGLLPACSSVATFSHGKRIAITFDDAPLPDGPLFTGIERADRLVRALGEAGVPQAALFVTTSNIKERADYQRLMTYANAGHVLANHSHGHERVTQVGAAAYLADVDRAQAVLANLPNVRPWFRYPYLSEGADAVTRDAVRVGLAERGLSNGYVTVDAWDWALVGLMQRAKAANQKINMDALRQLYIEMMLSAVATYDALAREMLGRSPDHILLAHENDLQALFIGDLVRALRRRGWTIVSPDEAYSDRLAGQVPDTLHNGNGRVAAIAAAKGVSTARLRDRYHDFKLLEQLFQERVIER